MSSSLIAEMTQAALQSALHAIAQNENLKNPKVEIDDSPNRGYIASVNKIALVDAVNGRRLNLFAKRKSEEANDQWAFFYANEADFYKKVVPAFREIISAGSTTLPLVPKCYFANEELIVLEDLMASGYRVWNPLNRSLDRPHVVAVLEAYGKFHAFSFALRRKDPERFKSFGLHGEWLYTNFDRLTENGFYKGTVEKLADCFDQHAEFHYVEAIASFYGGGQLDMLEKMHGPMETEVLLHGDSWTHNFMFRYGEDEKGPKDVCMLDFQIMRRSSPAADLAYFLCTSACAQETFDCIDEYLKLYHQSLERNLTELNCPTSVYTWEILKDEWSQYSLKGLLMAGFILKMMIADRDELDAHKHIELPMQFDFVSRNEAMYQEKMRILIKYFYGAGILKS